ncbi:MAG: tetratricopeptide repeat protein, partial [Rhodospirillales bacterium]|nr:tetratricopeptide repeat protein [Rhodospirillales bacterium]
MKNLDLETQSSPDIEQSLGQVLQHHGAGRLAEAKSICHGILQTNPDQPDALHLLGMIAHQAGGNQTAADLISKALAARPEFAEAHNNLGIVLFDMGEVAQARECYLKALAIHPEFAEALNNLGLAQFDLGQTEEAVTSYLGALDIKPRSAEAHNNLGMALQELARPQEAEASYRRALAIQPGYAQAHNNLGLMLADLERPGEAAQSFRLAIATQPDFAAAHNNLGRVLIDLKRREEAVASYLEALRLRPGVGDDLIELIQAIRQNYSSGEVTIPLEEMEGLTASQTEGLGQFNFPPKQMKRKDNYHLDSSGLRIVLLQPPPWKIAEPGRKRYTPAEGGPSKGQQLPPSVDPKIVTYGLLSIAAQVLSRDRPVALHNMSDFTWAEVEKVIGETKADLFGITSKSFNLRGAGALADLIRQNNPNAHIVMGGSHPTAQPAELLKNFKSVDSVVIGEGELAFLEIAEKLDHGEPVTDIAGTAWREGGEVRIGPARTQVKDVDVLASPHLYFPVRTFLTSRGCPFQCTFCASQVTWGRSLRFHSEDYIFRSLEKAVLEDGLKFLFIKDDTFSASRKRILSICQNILQQDLNFLWSCDTRVDSLDENVLRAMRLAGCQRISLGVESGSPEILDSIKKKSSPEQIAEVTKKAKKFGFQVRFYMIIGNRGETLDCFRQTLEMIKETRPTEFLFHNLSFYPGTEEFETFKSRKKIASDIFYQTDNDVLNEGFAHDIPAPTREILNGLSA